MTIKRMFLTLIILGLVLNFGGLATARTVDPLPSWNDGKAKQSIIDFVTKTTKKGAPEFVLPAERIATFDNDGTLWPEQPMYFQVLFAIDRVITASSSGGHCRTKFRGGSGSSLRIFL